MPRLASIPATLPRWHNAYAAPRDYTVTDLYGVPKKATRYEYNTAEALKELHLGFYFQVSFFGGRQLKGGIVVDFIVKTIPLPTPLWVHGSYWHSGRQRTIDLMQQSMLFMYMAGSLNKGVVLWGEEVESIADAKLAIKKKVMV